MSLVRRAPGRSRRAARGHSRHRGRRGGRRPSIQLPWAWLGGAAVLIGGLIAVLAVTGDPGAAVAHESTPDLLVLVTGTSNERQPALPDETRQQLRSLALSDPDPSAMVLGVNGDGTPRSQTFDLTPRRKNGDKEHSPKRLDTAADDHVDSVEAAVEGTAATVPGHALLSGLQEAGRTPVHTMVVISSGVDTNDPFDLRKTGFDYRSADLVAFLKKKNALPRLAGKEVILALSPTAGAQTTLDEPSLRNVERLWTDLLHASGATVRLTQSRSQDAPAARVSTPTVEVPKILTPTPQPTPGGGTTSTFILPANLMFEPDTANLLDRPSAEAQLHTVLDDVDIRTTISIVGHTAHVADPRDDGRPLSRRRAQVVHDLLIDLAVPESAITDVEGVGELRPVVQPPDDPRNRAVVVVLTHRS